MSDNLIRPQSLSKTYEDFLYVYNWLSSKVSISSGSRLEVYKKVIGDLLAIEDGEERFEAYLKNKNVANTASYEVHEFASLRRLIKLVDLKIPQNTLIKLIKGTLNYAEENGNSAQARNFLYELSVASRFAERENIKIDLTQDTDVVLNYGMYQFAIECKRVRSEKQLVSNISKAAKQLKNRYKQKKIGKSIRGLIFISVTSVINPTFKFAAAATSDFMREGITKQLNDLCVKHSQRIREIPELKEKETLGIVFQATVPFVVSFGEGINVRSRFFPVKNTTMPFLKELLQIREG